MVGVVVIEAPSLIDARLRAALEAVEAGVDFAEGHEIDTVRAGLVPPERLERLLSIEEANRLLKDLMKSTNRNPGPKRNLEPGFLRWTLGERADLARYRCGMIACNP
jgi:hypothetical protein